MRRNGVPLDTVNRFQSVLMWYICSWRTEFKISENLHELLVSLSEVSKSSGAVSVLSLFKLELLHAICSTRVDFEKFLARETTHDSSATNSLQLERDIETYRGDLTAKEVGHYFWCNPAYLKT